MMSTSASHRMHNSSRVKMKVSCIPSSPRSLWIWTWMQVSVPEMSWCWYVMWPHRKLFVAIVSIQIYVVGSEASTFTHQKIRPSALHAACGCLATTGCTHTSHTLLWFSLTAVIQGLKLCVHHSNIFRGQWATWCCGATQWQQGNWVGDQLADGRCKHSSHTFRLHNCVNKLACTSNLNYHPKAATCAHFMWPVENSLPAFHVYWFHSMSRGPWIKILFFIFPSQRFPGGHDEYLFNDFPDRTFPTAELFINSVIGFPVRGWRIGELTTHGKFQAWLFLEPTMQHSFCECAWIKPHHVTCIFCFVQFQQMLDL